jgi:hypothetical protein
MTGVMVSLKEQNIIQIKKIKKDNPEFELSKFCQTALDNYFEKSACNDSNVSKDVLILQIQKQKADIESHQKSISSCFKEIEVLQSKLFDISEMEKNKIIEEERARQTEIRKQEDMEKNAREMFEIITNRLMEEEEFKEYFDGRKDGRFEQLHDYLLFKGLVEHEVKEKKHDLKKDINEEEDTENDQKM